MSETPSEPRNSRGLLVHVAVALVIAAAVLVTYAPLRESAFLNWDEESLLVDNARWRGLTSEQLQWMFGTTLFGHYQPVVWLTFAADHALSGLDAPSFRRSQLLLHIANALVLYGLLCALPWDHRERRILRPLSAAAGALFFALHPLRVEPVSWLAARNDLLATLFGLSTFAAWLAARHRTGFPRLSLLGLSLAAYVLGLASKATLMTLPFVLLIVDVYPLRRFTAETRESLSRVLGEKIPYFVAAAAFGSVALFAKGDSDGLGSLGAHGLAARLTQAVWSMVFYLWKTVWPSDLSPLYLLGKAVDPRQPKYLIAFATAAALVGAAVAVRRRRPAVTAAAAAYAVLLLPVLGLVQSGAQLVADRYTYLACLPWAVLLAAGVDLLSRTPRPLVRSGAVAVLALVLGAFGVLSWRQAHVWTDSIRLWDRVLAVEPDNYYAYQNRGRVHQVRRELPAAIADYSRALELRPDYAISWRSRGIARREAADYEGALGDLSRALTFEPGSHQLYFDRSTVQRSVGRTDAELADLEAALAIEPAFARALAARGRARAERGDGAGAAADFDAAVALDPGDPRIWAFRGEAAEATGDVTAAMQFYERALALARPDWPRRTAIEERLRALTTL